MRAIEYRRTGDPSVPTLVQWPDPEPGPGEVRVRVDRAGVNPTDVESRRGAGSVGFTGPVDAPQVPGQDGAGEVTVPVGSQMVPDARWQFALIPTAPGAAKARAVDDLGGALAAGAIRAGVDAGLPLHHIPLARTADAHAAVEAEVVGKVLIGVTG